MYNLLVAFEPKAWKDGVYEFPRERVAVEYTADSISERYKGLEPEVIDELKSFPTLFCVEGEEGPSRVGYITSIKVNAGVVRIEFRFEPALRSLRKGFIKRSMVLFEVGRMELNRTHWAIKDGDLWSILGKLGIDCSGVVGAGNPGSGAASAKPAVIPDVTKRQVFIVHGHDDVMKFEMAAALRAKGCDPVILH